MVQNAQRVPEACTALKTRARESEALPSLEPPPCLLCVEVLPIVVTSKWLGDPCKVRKVWRVFSPEVSKSAIEARRLLGALGLDFGLIGFPPPPLRVFSASSSKVIRNNSNYKVRGACAPLMDSECHSMKTLVNAIDYACRLREGPGNKNISLGSVLKLLLVSHIAVVFAALLVVAVAKSHCIIWQLLWLPELLT